MAAASNNYTQYRGVMTAQLPVTEYAGQCLIRASLLDHEMCAPGMVT